MNRDKLIRNSIIGIFVALYTITSLVSTVHVIDFFRLTNPNWLAISLAIAFEIGAMASLAAIIILDKTSRTLIWFLFILLTLMQMMGNAYFAYNHAKGYETWVELFALNEEDPIYQKRILAIISGAILPLVALGFIKSLVDYIRPAKTNKNNKNQENKLVSTDLASSPAITETDNVKTVDLDIKTESKNEFELLDEDAIYNEFNSESPVIQDEIQTVKDESLNDTIKDIKDLTDTEKDSEINVIDDNKKEETVQQNKNKNVGHQKTHIVEEPGNGSIKRNFGPADINNSI